MFYFGGMSPLSFFLGLAVAVLCHVAFQWMYRHEPQIVPMLYRAARLAPRYDPLKHEPVYIERVKTW
jgi:hypothetical protein